MWRIASLPTICTTWETLDEAAGKLLEVP